MKYDIAYKILLILAVITASNPLALATGESVSVVTFTVAPGSDVTVPLVIGNANLVAGGSINLTFNPAIINAVGVSSGDLLGLPPVFNIDNTKGYVSVAVVSSRAVGTTTATLANITFRGVSAGTTSLSLISASLNTENGSLITPTISSGSITVNGEGSSSITSVTIIPTNTSASNEINITVAINNPGASFNGRVEGNVWSPSGTGKYLGWKNVAIPSGASTVTIIGPAGGEESSYRTYNAGTYLYDVYLENVDKGQVYTNPTDSKTGVPFTVGAAASVYMSNIVLSASPTVGSVMTLKVTISNPTASAFTGSMDANIWDSVRGYVLTPQPISIAAGGSTTLIFSYTPVNHGLHSYDFFMVSDMNMSDMNTKVPWGFSCMDYVAGIGFTVV